jgi:hypothetical protein
MFSKGLLVKEQKMSAKRNVSGLIGIVLLIMAAVSVIPILWDNETGLTSAGFAEAPTFVQVLIPLVVGFALVLLIWSQVPHK